MPSDFKLPEPVPDCPFTDPVLAKWWPKQNGIFQKHARAWTKLHSQDAYAMIVALTDTVGFKRELLSLVELLRTEKLPGREWRRLSEHDGSGATIRLLIQSHPSARTKRRKVIDAEWLTDCWVRLDSGEALSDFWTPLAWKPADSTELPAGFGEGE